MIWNRGGRKNTDKTDINILLLQGYSVSSGSWCLIDKVNLSAEGFDVLLEIKKWPFRAPKSSNLWRQDSFRLPTPVVRSAVYFAGIEMFIFGTKVKSV